MSSPIVDLLDRKRSKRCLRSLSSTDSPLPRNRLASDRNGRPKSTATLRTKTSAKKSVAPITTVKGHTSFKLFAGGKPGRYVFTLIKSLIVSASSGSDNTPSFPPSGFWPDNCSSSRRFACRTRYSSENGMVTPVVIGGLLVARNNTEHVTACLLWCHFATYRPGAVCRIATFRGFEIRTDCNSTHLQIVQETIVLVEAATTICTLPSSCWLQSSTCLRHSSDASSIARAAKRTDRRWVIRPSR